MPVDPARMLAALLGDPDAAYVAASDRWDLPAGPPAAEKVIVWGAGPQQPGVPMRKLATMALRRELALSRLRLSPRWPVASRHRLTPPTHRVGVRNSLRRSLRGGALVELRGHQAAPRPLDAVLADARVVVDPFTVHLGAGGVVTARGTRTGHRVVLRVAMEESAGGPARAAAALRHLTGTALPAPLLMAEGCSFGYSWTAESELAGRRPRRVPPKLAQDVVTAWARLPAGASPPTATTDDLTTLARLLPERAGALHALALRLAPAVAAWPARMRHGDLWSGNLLVIRGRLAGIIDWDGWHADALPGTDLLQLVATEERMATRRSVGQMWLARPWRGEDFKAITTPYWRRVGVRFDDEYAELLGIAWWAAAMAGTMTRGGAPTRDEKWLHDNVDAVLALYR